MKKLAILAAFLLLPSCAHTDIYSSEVRAVGPKVIALDAPRLPWVMQIERRLREAGFQVLRWESTQTVTAARGAGQVATFDEATTQYILRLDGAASLNVMNRCFGGGFNFDYISAELIDVRTNQSIASYGGQGYSEGCAPLSGKIFKNITDLVKNAWEK